VKRTHLILVVALTFACSSPAFAQRSHLAAAHLRGMGPPGVGSSMGEANKGGAMSSSNMSHASPNDVLSHNTAIAGKIKTLTGEDAPVGMQWLTSLGQCVAAAHVARTWTFPVAFDALKAKVTGTGSMSLGKAIEPAFAQRECQIRDQGSKQTGLTMHEGVQLLG